MLDAKMAKKAGVDYFLTICTKDDGFKKILDIIDNNNNIYGTYGIHPHEAKNHNHITLENILDNFKSNKKSIGKKKAKK